MNELLQLLRAVKDYYKVEGCGVSLTVLKDGSYQATVKDDNGENACTAQHQYLDSVVHDLAVQWLVSISPTGALYALLQATKPQ